MIEVLRQQFSPDSSQEEKINKTREFLQILCLKILYEKNAFDQLAFVGGTALRILYDLKRFSEDLDFCLVDKKGYTFSGIIAEIVREFKLYGLKVESKAKEDKNVHSAFLKFGGLMKELELSHLAAQNLSINLEVDSNPPSGGRTENTLVNKIYMFNLVHFDLPSLYATKLHACFFRKYTKGRDFYDFIWYLGRKVKPSYELLNNVIRQTEGRDLGVEERNFKDFLLAKIKKIDFEKAKSDVERFLEDKSELRLFNIKIIQDTINSVYST